MALRRPRPWPLSHATALGRGQSTVGRAAGVPKALAMPPQLPARFTQAGRGPTRTVAVETRYRRYTEWCASRGHTGVELVLATALWKEVGQEAGGRGVRVALEPNIVPYHAEAGVAFAC